MVPAVCRPSSASQSRCWPPDVHGRATVHRQPAQRVRPGQGITQGGPGLSTTFIIQYIFDKGFNQMQYGYASAISTVVMIIFALIAFAQFKVNNGGET